MNKCLCKFYVSVTRKENSFYNLKTSLLSVRAALDHHLKSGVSKTRGRGRGLFFLFFYFFFSFQQHRSFVGQIRIKAYY